MSGLGDVRRRAWETRRAKYGPAGHGGAYSRQRAIDAHPGLLDLVIRLHVEGALSEGQVVAASRLDRVEVRRLADAAREQQEIAREAMRHAFVPNRKYPWFCGLCGYPPHEPLKHRSAPSPSAGS